jgi:hypothetical protein
MRIHVDFEIGPRWKRALLWVAVPVVMVSGGAVAFAQTQTGASMLNDGLIGTALNALGQAVATLQAQVLVLQSADRVDRVTLASNGAVIAQTGAWIRQVRHPAPGRYALDFTTGTFASPPTCVTTPNTSDNPPPLVECYGVTAVCVVCQASSMPHQASRGDPSAPVDVGLSLVCVGR